MRDLDGLTRGASQPTLASGRSIAAAHIRAAEMRRGVPLSLGGVPPDLSDRMHGRSEHASTYRSHFRPDISAMGDAAQRASAIVQPTVSDFETLPKSSVADATGTAEKKKSAREPLWPASS